jgi:chloramphenicol O-acetyltransferase type B
MIEVGHGTYGHEEIQIRGDMNNITIGKYCSIATGVVMDGGFNHNVNFVSTFPFRNRIGVGEQNVVCKGDIHIGNDVWICENVLIMSGVTIGHGAIIGANSIVTKNVWPYSIVAGSPAKEIRKRFSDSQIEALLKIEWYNWTEEKIMAELPFATYIQEFINKHKI